MESTAPTGVPCECDLSVPTPWPLHPCVVRAKPGSGEVRGGRLEEAGAEDPRKGRIKGSDPRGLEPPRCTDTPSGQQGLHLALTAIASPLCQPCVLRMLHWPAGSVPPLALLQGPLCRETAAHQPAGHSEPSTSIPGAEAQASGGTQDPVTTAGLLPRSLLAHRKLRCSSWLPRPESLPSGLGPSRGPHCTDCVGPGGSHTPPQPRAEAQGSRHLLGCL